MPRLLTIFLLGLASVRWAEVGAIDDSRGVQPLRTETTPLAVDTFDRKESAALFVGVRLFPYDKTLADVRYAVDDAVDLAFVLALDDRVRLIDADRVVLALSGEPQKPESQRNLKRLVAAGAQIRAAGQADILTALDEQARAVGKHGVLVITFAGHGVSFDGTQYLLTATSVLRHRETAVSESKIRDIASKSAADRTLILIDACRERLRDDQRNGEPDKQSAASLIRAMAETHGQVVLSAAAAGQYAYDDDSRRNGVFTAAVIDGIQCEAAADEHGLITVDKLAQFVEQRVLFWIRRNRNAEVAQATQVTWDGQARTMPLAVCRRVASARKSDCTIAIGSSPGGAMVSLDGQVVGKTPLSIRLAQDQRGEVILAKSGYRAATAEVDCRRSEPVFLTLRPRAGEYQVLLSDDFRDNRNNWLLSTEPGASAQLKDGSYLLGSKHGGLTFTTVSPDMDPDSDFAISVTARYLSGSQDSAFGLVWGARPDHFWLFGITPQGNATVGAIDLNRGGSAVNDVGVVHKAIRTNGGTNLLKVTKTGDRLRFSVNDVVVYEMVHQPFFGQGIGLITLSGPGIAVFDDFKVEGSRK